MGAQGTHTKFLLFQSVIEMSSQLIASVESVVLATFIQASIAERSVIKLSKPHKFFDLIQLPVEPLFGCSISK